MHLLLHLDWSTWGGEKHPTRPAIHLSTYGSVCMDADKAPRTLIPRGVHLDKAELSASHGEEDFLRMECEPGFMRL